MVVDVGVTTGKESAWSETARETGYWGFYTQVITSLLLIPESCTYCYQLLWTWKVEPYDTERQGEKEKARVAKLLYLPKRQKCLRNVCSHSYKTIHVCVHAFQKNWQEDVKAIQNPTLSIPMRIRLWDSGLDVGVDWGETWYLITKKWRDCCGSDREPTYNTHGSPNFAKCTDHLLLWMVNSSIARHYSRQIGGRMTPRHE